MPAPRKPKAATPATPPASGSPGAPPASGTSSVGSPGVAKGYEPTKYTLEGPAMAAAAGDRQARAERLRQTEWLLTNGLGGFAMGTASGVPSRRYHGLLIAAMSPPVGRVMLVNATVDTLVFASDGQTPEERIELSTFRFEPGGSVLHPDGETRVQRFEKDLTCRHTFVGNGLTVTRNVRVHDAENATSVTYRVTRGAKDGTKQGVRLLVRPLLSLRDMHSLIRRRWADAFSASGSLREVHVRRGHYEVHLRSDAMTFNRDGQWWENFHYAIDAARGQDCVEDLYSPGEFELELAAGETSVEATIQMSAAPLSMLSATVDEQRVKTRRSAMLTAALASRADPITPVIDSDRRMINALVDAADAFLVARKNPVSGALDQTSVIAGYPWFADWGRDTSIALPGLMLSTGRFDDAKRSLIAFASHRRNGIVPNVFDDRTGVPEYNTVDASLWFIHACCAYARRSGDRATFDGTLAPACLDVVTHYRKGTDFNIAMDPMDKLITAGSEATQLTWMDAKRDGVAFTPRHGKAVEINALWYSALNELAAALGPSAATMAANLTDLANAVGKSFRGAFWDQHRGCLYDRLMPTGSGDRPGWTPIPEMRPNQLFAVSLPHSALTSEQTLGVVAAAKHHLLTPMGVRTLGPSEPGFAPHIAGNMWERDRAYHNGTAWPWLLGAYAEAVLRAGEFSSHAKAVAREAIEPMLLELWAPRGGLREPIYGNCIGQAAEIYDASEPQRPQGCTAQAWSVAELLRVMLILA